MGITCSKNKEFVFLEGGGGEWMRDDQNFFMGTKVLYPLRSFGVFVEKLARMAKGQGQGQKASQAHRLYI